MDYIDRLKRAAIRLGQHGAFVRRGAGARPINDSRPRPVGRDPRRLRQPLRKARCQAAGRFTAHGPMLDKGDVMAGVTSEQDNVDRAGEAKWCDAFRLVVEKYKDGLLEPVR